MIPINEVNGPYFWYGSINGIYIYIQKPRQRMEEIKQELK